MLSCSLRRILKEFGEHDVLPRCQVDPGRVRVLCLRRGPAAHDFFELLGIHFDDFRRFARHGTAGRGAYKDQRGEPSVLGSLVLFAFSMAASFFISRYT